MIARSSQSHCWPAWTSDKETTQSDWHDFGLQSILFFPVNVPDNVVTVFYFIVLFLVFSLQHNWSAADNTTVEINQRQLALQTNRKQAVRPWTGNSSDIRTALLAHFKTARYPGMLTMPPCSQHMMSWGPFANNGLLNPQPRGQPDFMMPRYFMSFKRLPCHISAASASSAPQCDCVKMRCEDTVQKQTFSVCLSSNIHSLPPWWRRYMEHCEIRW